MLFLGLPYFFSCKFNPFDKGSVHPLGPAIEEMAQGLGLISNVVTMVGVYFLISFWKIQSLYWILMKRLELQRDVLEGLHLTWYSNYMEKKWSQVAWGLCLAKMNQGNSLIEHMLSMAAIPGFNPRYSQIKILR